MKRIQMLSRPGELGQCCQSESFKVPEKLFCGKRVRFDRN